MMEGGPSRKRLRRSTRTCYQCRKRKVKCQLTDEDVEICAECVKSGTQCTVQRPATELSGGESSRVPDQQGLESRLERVESLMRRLVDAQERSPSAEGLSGVEPVFPAFFWDDILDQSPANVALPVGDPGPVVVPPSDTPDAKQSLVALLPSAQDAITIVTNTTAWLWGPEDPPGTVLGENDALRLLEVAAISRGSAMHVAKALLLFALYMQQLPAAFDAQFMDPQGVESAIGLIVKRVKLFIISREDEACSMDGLECLTLLSLIQLNDGAIRKAWMTFRRVLDIARLKGLQNSFSVSARSSSSSTVALRRRLWLSTVCGDCYCSLLLGLEPGLGTAPFGPDDADWDDPLADQNANVQRRIGLIVARIAQRNAMSLHQDPQALQEINGALNSLQDSLPLSWWRAPSFHQDAPLNSAKEPNRLMCQLWFFQARIFAHLPIAFGPVTSSSLSSLESCMEACRITLQRHSGIRHARARLSRCRTVDQSAFIAAVVLLLAKVQLRLYKPEKLACRYDSDRALVEQIVDAFDAAGKACRGEQVARQSSEILSTMLNILAADLENVMASRPSDSDQPTGRRASCSSEAVFESSSQAGKSFMEDIIASSIQPVLDIHSPASHLINLLFATKEATSNVTTRVLTQTHNACS